MRPLLSVAMSDPPYMQALKGEYGWMKFGWFRSYHAKYMVDGRFKPVIHVITFVMCLGYLMEYPHLKRTSSQPTSMWWRAWSRSALATPAPPPPSPCLTPPPVA